MREHLFSVTKKDLRIDTFRSGGKGGQHQNKTDSGVRIVHIESRAVGESRNERSQLQNKHNAFRRMAASREFQMWHKKKAAELMNRHASIEQYVERAMACHNLKVEILDGERGVWVELDAEVA